MNRHWSTIRFHNRVIPRTLYHTSYIQTFRHHPFRILRTETFCSYAVGAACGAAVYFIRKGKADLETDFDDFKDEFEEEEPAPAERTYTTLPKTKGAEDAAPDPESAACNKGSETADTEAESATAESEEEDAEKESCADREVSPQEESEVTTE